MNREKELEIEPVTFKIKENKVKADATEQQDNEEMKHEADAKEDEMEREEMTVIRAETQQQSSLHQDFFRLC